MDIPPVSVIYNGVVYKRNPAASQRAHCVYYRSSASWDDDHGVLHRDVWRDHNGPIPDGSHIHHADFDPFNNDPSNLVAVTPAEHGRLHATGERLEQIRAMQRLGQEAARAWHASAAGLAWHREAGRRSWEGREPGYRLICESCGAEFDAWRESARYCSRRCINRARERKYLQTALCPVCGTEFEQDRYRKRPETCSRRCGAALRRQRRPGCL